MPAPVNVRLQTPTVLVDDWPLQVTQWAELNREAHGNPEFYPLTVKAAYVVGILHDICTSVTQLLQVDRALLGATYMPAYGVCAAGIEILGRCISGQRGIYGSERALLNGLKWLMASEYLDVDDDAVFVTTGERAYTLQALAHLRHFVAHGQATVKPESPVRGLRDIDRGLLAPFPARLADGLERWWNLLQSDRALCNNLALAEVMAFRHWPVHNMWMHFELTPYGRYRSIRELFNEFDWRV